MNGGMDRHSEVFREEALELLAELEAALLELEDRPGDDDLIARVFRAMHTIKGSGAMFGFDDIAAFTHDVETVFDLVRNGRIPVSRDLIDMTLAACDQIRHMLDASGEGGTAFTEKADEITAAMQSLIEEAGEGKPSHPEKTGPGTPRPEEGKGEEITYRIRFRPARNIFLKGVNPSCLLNELRSLGECRVVAQTDTVPLLDRMDPEYCYLYWDVILTTSGGIDAIKDVFIFIDEDCELKIDVIDTSSGFGSEESYKRVGEILVETGDLTADDLKKVLSSQKRIGEMLIDQDMIDPGHLEAALIEQTHLKEKREKQLNAATASSIRVSSEKLDKLVDLVGEMVTVQARLSQTCTKRGDPELILIAEVVERLTEELRDSTMDLRLLPIGTLFGKFRRVVRDLSNELGKELEILTEGAETELDKSVIERLSDPIMHLIRNCIDHGIEAPETRKAAGKPVKGILHLSASHSGPNVVIRISDDGAGLDREKIRAKAVERNLASPDAQLSIQDINDLILSPGFSTAREITNVSGRGVGLDVVSRTVNSLRGSIEISSEPGEGTSITLKLPLTMAIIEGLLVEIGSENFILPLSVVEECIELSREDVRKAHGRHLVRVREKLVPYIGLREHFRIDGECPQIEQVVIISLDGHRVGFVVDRVVGEHQTVLKSLGTFYKDIDGISGATILGDGSVALILDVQGLIRTVESLEKAENGCSV